MKLDDKLLDSLSEQAKLSPRLRVSYDLRNSADDNSQRVLNALEPGTVVPIHRHVASSETIVVLRGKLLETFYDDQGNVIESYVCQFGSHQMGCHVPLGQWHSVKCLESGTVFFEAKDGGYEPLSEDDIMKAPIK